MTDFTRCLCCTLHLRHGAIMILLREIKLRPGEKDTRLLKKAAGILGCRPEQIHSMRIMRESVDARKKPDIFMVYEVMLSLPCCDGLLQEEAYIKKHHIRSAEAVSFKSYQFPYAAKGGHERPVVVGMGPAGLFCALMLSRAGYAPVLLERGKCVEERAEDVERFWKGEPLDPESNVQFGEGGAGTFSDGKLNTLVKGSRDIHRFVLEEFVRFGASPEIVYAGKPHIGTDVLRTVVRNMREEIIALGGEVHFKSKVERLVCEHDMLSGLVYVQDGVEKELSCTHLCLAIGHSARDTFRELYKEQIFMEPKPFAVGVRMEHPQSMINEAQYGKGADMEKLHAASYKLTAKAENGRAVYSFCMCPGGYVVNASSQEQHLAVNGMSYAARNSENANSAIVVGVHPQDFGAADLFGGMHFQEELEARAYRLAGGAVPVQTYGDFAADRKSAGLGAILPQVKGLWDYANLRTVFPDFINDALLSAIPQFGRKISGFDRPDALMLGVESRTSSPVRILRDERLQSNMRGLFPCGEGAGYAGGITSAAMDGIRVAEAIALDINDRYK